MMTLLSQNLFIRKILANTNSHAKFGAPISFGLEVR